MMKKIAIIYMGGTFACVGEPLAPLSASAFLPLLQNILPTHLNLHCFAAPSIQDSSAYSAVDWLLLIQFIQDLQLKHYQHFIIIHGTDTLSYVAATLSRFLQQSCHVIVTGSQYPLFNLQGTQLRDFSDASTNLNAALDAIQHITTGVHVTFGEQILQGVDTLKVHTTDLNAFTMQSRLNHDCTPEENTFIVQDVHVEKSKNLNLINIMLQPIEISQLNISLQNFLAQPPHFLILQAYGSGNLAVNDDLLETFQQLREKGCCLILNTQVPFGPLQQHYAISDWMNHAPILHSDAASHADLYAKILKMYLQYATVDQWYSHWSESSELR